MNLELIDLGSAEYWRRVAVSAEMAGWYTQNLEAFYGDNVEKLNGVMYGNALKLFPRLKDILFD